LPPERPTLGAVSAPRQFRQLRFELLPGATELILVRHGESEASIEGRDFPLVDGHGDPPLSAEGRLQADAVADRLAGERFGAIYVTPLRRTSETAAPLARRVSLTPVVEPDLREVFLGEWEGGLYRQKVSERDPIAVRMFTEQRWDVIPGAESSTSLSARVGGAARRIATAHPDERVVVFAHGGSIGVLLAEATGSEPFAFVGSDNAAISRLVVSAERWILRGFNDTAHLGGSPPPVSRTSRG
jgi:probable phosphoglycerate mutase